MPQDSMPPESSQTPPELVQDLNAMVEPVAWQWVMPHVQRDAVVVVNPNLDLVEVGAAIAADQVSLVQRWIGEALIAKPTADELSQWDQDKRKRFNALIVQPYVLVQAIHKTNTP